MPCFNHDNDSATTASGIEINQELEGLHHASAGVNNERFVEAPNSISRPFEAKGSDKETLHTLITCASHGRRIRVKAHDGLTRPSLIHSGSFRLSKLTPSLQYQHGSPSAG